MTVPEMTSPLSAMPSRTAGLDETWMFLKPGLDHVMIHGDARTFPNYTILYTMIYNYYTSGMFFVPLAPYHSANLLISAAGDNAGSNLYWKLSTYYIEHLKPIIAVGIVL